ncbi:coth protein-domain-containing protein [Parasitella parasitica]|nr:coth protein-domain-containing protein [Parasitella parasitica]
MKSLAFVAFALLAAVDAANVNFKVIAPNASKQVQVNVGGTLTTLKAADPDVPFYTGSADLPDNKTYKYVVDGKTESFDRTFAGGDSTKNEFYERQVTYATNIPELPSILSEGAWSRGSTSDPIWDSNYIPSIFVTADEDDMEDLIEDVSKSTYKAKITFIGPDSVKSIENCVIGLHKPGRKHNDAKQTWVWTLPEGTFYADRNWFKIRHMEEDPTQMREKLYADIARNMGTYANEANMIRFFVNKEGMGTFNMLDDVIMYSYINAMFYGGDAPDQMGPLFDGGSGADFNPSTGYDSFIANVESPLGTDAIAPFAKAIAAVDFSKDEEVKAIAEYFDYDQFLRFMVMEFLTGSWDGYWQEQTNDGAYIDTKENKLYYLAQDFDATFGVNLPFEKDFVSLSYGSWVKKFPKAYLINKFLSNPSVNATFQGYLSTAVENIFNMDVLKSYVEARHNFIYPDLKWDRSIKQRSPGNIFGWTAQQTTDNLYKAVTAPGPNAASTGGAQYGLLEWIELKEKSLRSQLKSSTKQASTSSAPAQASAASADDSKIAAASVKEAAAAAAHEEIFTSAAGKALPQVLSAIAVVGAAAALL